MLPLRPPRVVAVTTVLAACCWSVRAPCRNRSSRWAAHVPSRRRRPPTSRRRRPRRPRPRADWPGRSCRKPRGPRTPVAHDKVTINFTGWTPDGEVIASSIPDGEPWTFVMDDLIKGLSEGLRLMGKGEKRRLWIPADLATSGRPKRRGPAGPAVFDVELVEFVKMPDPIAGAGGCRRAPGGRQDEPRPAWPTRFSSAAKARTTRRRRSTVEVHYSGWTPDGTMFDSSVQPRQADQLPVERRDQGMDRGRAVDGGR